MKEWIAKLFEDPDFTRMGHDQRAADLNLGLGWIYYSLARVFRPKTAVVIGSYRGFVPLVLAKALSDNREGGQVVFLDPSLVDDFWKDPKRVKRHFAKYQVKNIRHLLMTTQQFVASEAYRSLGEIGILFIDGYHTEEQARFDYEALEQKLAPGGIALFHDSVRCRTSRIYGEERAYEHSVKRYIDTLKRNPSLQVFDLPFADGITLVRRADRADPGRDPMTALKRVLNAEPA